LTTAQKCFARKEKENFKSKEIYEKEKVSMKKQFSSKQFSVHVERSFVKTIELFLAKVRKNLLESEEKTKLYKFFRSRSFRQNVSVDI